MTREALELGYEVRDSISGLAGIVVAITEWLNGCVRVVVQPRELKDGKPVDTSCFDIEQLEFFSRGLAPVEKAPTGGDRDDSVAISR